jgi:hypothetical protein
MSPGLHPHQGGQLRITLNIDDTLTHHEVPWDRWDARKYIVCIKSRCERRGIVWREVGLRERGGGWRGGRGRHWKTYERLRWSPLEALRTSPLVVEDLVASAFLCRLFT